MRTEKEVEEDEVFWETFDNFKNFIDEKTNALNFEVKKEYTIFCNPPRSINGKFVDKLYSIWENHNLDIVMLLCWNDLGNKYGQKILHGILEKKNKINYKN